MITTHTERPHSTVRSYVVALCRVSWIGSIGKCRLKSPAVVASMRNVVDAYLDVAWAVVIRHQCYYTTLALVHASVLDQHRSFHTAFFYSSHGVVHIRR